ncbi:hypothetical protein ACWDA3_59415 [Nonomuraea rubra]
MDDCDGEIGVRTDVAGHNRAGHDLVERVVRVRAGLAEDAVDDAELKRQHPVPGQDGHPVAAIVGENGHGPRDPAEYP